MTDLRFQCLITVMLVQYIILVLMLGEVLSRLRRIEKTRGG